MKLLWHRAIRTGRQYFYCSRIYLCCCILHSTNQNIYRTVNSCYFAPFFSKIISKKTKNKEKRQPENRTTLEHIALIQCTFKILARMAWTTLSFYFGHYLLPFSSSSLLSFLIALLACLRACFFYFFFFCVVSLSFACFFIAAAINSFLVVQWK